MINETQVGGAGQGRPGRRLNTDFKADIQTAKRIFLKLMFHLTITQPGRGGEKKKRLDSRGVSELNQAEPSFNADLDWNRGDGANGCFVAPLKRTHFSPVKRLILID